MLADLPGTLRKTPTSIELQSLRASGLQDTNLARVRLTQNYLLKSDHVFLVTNIMRAKTDASLRSSLYRALAQHIPLEWEESAGQSFKMAIICTKIDVTRVDILCLKSQSNTAQEINVTTNRREFCGENKPIPPAEMSRLERELAKAKSLNNQQLAKACKRKYVQGTPEEFAGLIDI